MMIINYILKSSVIGYGIYKFNLSSGVIPMNDLNLVFKI